MKSGKWRGAANGRPGRARGTGTEDLAKGTKGDKDLKTL